MYIPFLYNLIPRPIPIKTESVEGKLLIEGNIEHNYIRFRFCFSDPKETAPLAVSVKAAGEKYIYNCIIRDYSKHEAQTAVFHPDFFTGQQFMITGVEPLVELAKKEYNN